jgi:hypothetical protein
MIFALDAKRLGSREPGAAKPHAPKWKAEKENQGEAFCERRANGAILTSVINNTLMIGLT